MDPIVPLSWSDFPEDVQLCILSFLRRSERESFACTSKKFFALCNTDERLWFLKCSRSWGSQTQIQKWGGGKISYRNLFHLLNLYGNLIGFWNDYYSEKNPSPNSKLILFEWGSFYITGYRVSPSKCGGYDVVKKPFLWITATADGQMLNYLDRNETLPLTEQDLFRQDSEKLRTGDLILVDIYLTEDRGMTFRENSHFLEFRKLLDTGNRREEYDTVFRSPPDGLMAQLRVILASKASVTGNLPSKKERRREWQREKDQQRRVCKWRSKCFLKIKEPSPTPSRPLQGLWKGIGPNESLNFYLVLYGKLNNFMICEAVVGNYFTNQFDRQIAFLAFTTTAFVESPTLGSEEEHTYNARTHLRPIANQARRDRATSFEDEALDVSRICFVLSLDQYLAPGNQSGNMPDGRVWLYANGTFGFGYLRDDYIVDLRPIAKNGYVLDSI
ncbi:F-box protein At3g12350-like [Henckelia pumila]|uniref:F-box protein At3g12350-like n=1 Tax=Henckelia pumila TaxID=405737 RepID=UPI003C6E56F7